MNHYNGATVWGTLDKFQWEKTETGKDYLEIFVDCQHASLGNVRVLGRIWKQDVGEALLKQFQRGSEMRLEGNIQQYQGRNEVTRTTFNFYRFRPGPLKEKKAAFRLVGEVKWFEGNCLKVLVRQEAKEGYEKKEEVFEVFVPNEILLGITEPSVGELVRLKGYIAHEEDEFGDAKGPQRPVVRQLEINDLV